MHASTGKSLAWGAAADKPAARPIGSLAESCAPWLPLCFEFPVCLSALAVLDGRGKPKPRRNNNNIIINQSSSVNEELEHGRLAVLFLLLLYYIVEFYFCYIGVVQIHDWKRYKWHAKSELPFATLTGTHTTDMCMEHGMISSQLPAARFFSVATISFLFFSPHFNLRTNLWSWIIARNLALLIARKRLFALCLRGFLLLVGPWCLVASKGWPLIKKKDSGENLSHLHTLYECRSW